MERKLAALRLNLKNALGVDKPARIIRGFAVITYGEALGHEMWIDAAMLRQVAAAGNATPDGVKSHFTHPTETDGLGNYLGRVRNFRVDGSVVRADLYLAAAASHSPKGDLAGYVLRLAEEDPAALGASIRFARDLDAEGAFRDQHTKLGRFTSPDAGNVANYTHARLAELKNVDLVDEPAANAGGLFSAGKLVPGSPEYQQYVAAGAAQARERFEALTTVFAHDLPFAFEAFKAGAGVEQAQRVWQARRQQAAHAYASAHNCSLTAAYSALSAQDRAKEKPARK